MLALLRAAEDFANGLEEARQVAARELRLAEAGRVGWEQALRNLEMMLVPEALLARPGESFTTLVAERERNSPTRVSRNVRKRAAMARKRGRVGEERTNE